MTSAFLTLTKGQGHSTRSKVTDVEVSAFSECFLFVNLFIIENGGESTGLLLDVYLFTLFVSCVFFAFGKMHFLFISFLLFSFSLSMCI